MNVLTEECTYGGMQLRRNASLNLVISGGMQSQRYTITVDITLVIMNKRDRTHIGRGCGFPAGGCGLLVRMYVEVN